MRKMEKIKPPNYKFCPFCSKKLETRKEEEYLRKYCPFCQWIYYPQVFTSVAAVIIRKGKFLMVKRGRLPHKNTWMFPGGFVEYCEHPLVTLGREVEEETGLKFVEAKYIDIIENNDDYRTPGNLIIFYMVDAKGEKIKTDKEENEAIEWFDFFNPPKIGFKAHREIVKLIQDQSLKKRPQ